LPHQKKLNDYYPRYLPIKIKSGYILRCEQTQTLWIRPANKSCCNQEANKKTDYYNGLFISFLYSWFFYSDPSINLSSVNSRPFTRVICFNNTGLEPVVIQYCE